MAKVNGGYLQCKAMKKFLADYIDVKEILQNSSPKSQVRF